MPVFAGVDVGSTTTKIVLMDGNGAIVGSRLGPTGAEHRSRSREVLQAACGEAGLSIEDVDYCVATGYGRINVPYADRQITEITCHARGVLHFFPDARSLIDIGGQDCKGVSIRGGKVDNFIMNDKCAAGCGRYLEVLAKTLHLTIDELGDTALRSGSPAEISSTCTVFAEQEMVGKIAAGYPVEDVVAGVCEAISRRVYGLVMRIQIQPETVFTGGGAKNAGIRAFLERQLGYGLKIPPVDPQLVGGVGAAIFAGEFSRR
ncbi:MAG: acyl-CoA dehydratase activase [Clostridia bacterium]|nr:acyl-CoA dehydratase activase [Clostridia bacterium]